MTETFKAACIQLNCGADPAENRRTWSCLAREAADAGADLIMTPETSNIMQPDREKLEAAVLPMEGHPDVTAAAELARRLGRWLLIGSFLLRGEAGRPVNRSFLFSPEGDLVVHYDKIHMFDVEIPDGQSYRESERFAAGGATRLVDLPWGRIGLSICYDMRFPALYQDLALAGALFLTAPSAFTRFTGMAHWHMLLRARAIETGSYLFAPAQCGDHPGGRQTYGHSLIISPWGEVLADAGEEPGFVLSEIDPAKVLAARQAIPALDHRREFSLRAS